MEIDQLFYYMSNNRTSCTKVLILTWNFPPKRGGMENLIHDIYSHLRHQLQVEVIAPYSRKHTTDPHVSRPSFVGFLGFTLFSIFQAINLLLRKKYRVIFGGSLAVVPIIALLKLMFPVRAIAYAHGLDIIYPNILYQSALRTTVRLLDGIICNSRNTCSLLLERFPKLRNVTVIPPGVDFEHYRRRVPRIIHRKYLLSVGRLTERKGLVPFIEKCFLKIKDECDDLVLVVVGEEPKDAMFHKLGYKQKIETCIRELHLQDRVYMMGWVDDKELLSLYQNCEVLVFPVVPSKGDVEGFGMVAIEAAAAGSPTVAFDVGGISDAIMQNKTGVLIPPGDYERMADVLLAILKGEQKFLMVGPHISEKFAWDGLCIQYRDYMLGTRQQWQKGNLYPNYLDQSS